MRGRPSLGDREHVTAALWPGLEALVDIERGSLNRSPFLADLLAWHIGRPDLIRHEQLVIEFTSESPARAAAVLAAAKPAGIRTRHCTLRVHPDVAYELEERRKRTGQARGVVIAHAIADSLGVSYAPADNAEEGLLLAM